MSDIENNILQAQIELKRFNLPWKDMVAEQLKYCLSVVSKESTPEKVEKLNMGLIAVREIDSRENLHSLLIEIQEHMYSNYLSFSEKARLGIQRR